MSKKIFRLLMIIFWARYGNAQGDASKGEAILKAKSTAYHELDQRVIGPALGPQLESETDDKWLSKWIRNNQVLIAAKKSLRRLRIYYECNQSAMSVFGDLSTVMCQTSSLLHA